MLPITGPTIDARILNILALQFLVDGNLVLKAGTFNVSINVITYDEGEESSLKAMWNLSNNSLNITVPIGCGFFISKTSRDLILVANKPRLIGYISTIERI